MDHQRPGLLSTQSPVSSTSTRSTPHRQPQSPFRYAPQRDMNEKDDLTLEIRLDDRYPSSSSRFTSRSRSPSPSPRRITHPPAPQFSTPERDRCSARRAWIPERVKPWLPVLMYALTSLIFVVAIAFYKAQLFTFLDDLAVWLRADVSFGYTVLFLLIFITTFPPLPLYSTLIVLAGYTFGAWAGAILSYLAALAGAIVVFLLSRTLLRGPISRWLDSCPTIKQVVRAVEKRPKLLFLVRLAPYPYNVMNCLLAAAPSLTFRTYTLCTAASLFKLIVHTSLGASIRSFKDYHTSSGQSGETEGTVASAWTIAGVVLCIAILVYLSIVARRAVDDEIGSERETGNAEEREGFLANADGDAADLEAGGARPMVELQR